MGSSRARQSPHAGRKPFVFCVCGWMGICSRNALFMCSWVWGLGVICDCPLSVGSHLVSWDAVFHFCLGLTDWGRLTSLYGSPGSVSLCWDSKHVPPHVALLSGFWGTNSGSHYCTAGTWLNKRFPQPPISWLCCWSECWSPHVFTLGNLPLHALESELYFCYSKATRCPFLSWPLPASIFSCRGKRQCLGASSSQASVWDLSDVSTARFPFGMGVT